MQNPFDAQHDQGESFGVTELSTDFFKVDKLEGSSRSGSIPTPEDLRRKAQECRDDAESYSNAELRAQLLAIAGEYDRLARRAEEFEMRAVGSVPHPLNGRALTHWFG
jgi:hypothetical protein